MTRRPVGSVYSNGRCWYLSLTIQGSRRSFPLRWASSQAEADRRREFVGSLLLKLRNAGHEDLAASICERAATDTGEGLDALSILVVEIAEGRVAPKSSHSQELLPNSSTVTFREVAALLTTGRLAEWYPGQVESIDHRENDRRLRLHVFPVQVGGRSIAETPIDEVERAHGDAILRRPSLPAGSRRHVGQVFRRVLTLAVEPLRLINENPLPKGWLPKPTQPEQGPCLFPEEEEALLTCTDVPLVWRMFFGFAIREAIRREKIAMLTWPQVTETPRGMQCRVPGKANKPPVRWFLRSDVAETLRRWKTLCPSEKWIYPAEALPRHRKSSKGKPLSVDKAAEKLREALEKSGVHRPDLFESEHGYRRLVFHDLRASNVTLAREAQVPDEVISQRTRHSEKATMDRYDRAPAEFDERLLDALVPMHEAIPELVHVVGEKLPILKREDKKK